jgi:tetratricopeptide (TPR) repeat protein
MAHNPAMKLCRPTTLRLLIASAIALCVATGRATPQSTNLLDEGEQKLREGRHADALAIYNKVLAESPDSYQANNQAGVALDLLGQYPEARKHFEKAIAVATNAEEKSRASRNMAMSYAFSRDCARVEKYQGPVVDDAIKAGKLTDAGNAANELARACLESGDIDRASEWYKKGHEAVVKDTSLTAAQKDLWEFRWEHAQARIAARRGDAAGAQKYVAAAKAILDKGTNPEQAPFLPYLTGYVAFYDGDYKTAVADFGKANQEDPFILCMLAQSYEKLGDGTKAAEYYKKALTSNAHNPANAYARPIAMKKAS